MVVGIPELVDAGPISFDAQEDSTSTRTPSLIYYNSHGAWRSAGDAAVTGGIQRQADERGWIKVDR